MYLGEENMKKYIVIYHAPDSWLKKMQSMSPEDHKKGMEPWMKWAKKCGAGLVDMGTPLENAQMISSNGSAPSKSDVVGYSILQAENIKKAVEMLKDHPHLTWAEGCKIEVHEQCLMPA